MHYHVSRVAAVRVGLNEKLGGDWCRAGPYVKRGASELCERSFAGMPKRLRAQLMWLGVGFRAGLFGDWVHSRARQVSGVDLACERL